MSGIEQPCLEKAKEDPSEFDFLVSVGKDGGVEDAWGNASDACHEVSDEGNVRRPHQERKAISSPAESALLGDVHVDPSKADTAMK